MPAFGIAEAVARVRQGARGAASPAMPATPNENAPTEAGGVGAAAVATSSGSLALWRGQSKDRTSCIAVYLDAEAARTTHR